MESTIQRHEVAIASLNAKISNAKGLGEARVTLEGNGEVGSMQFKPQTNIKRHYPLIRTPAATERGMPIPTISPEQRHGSECSQPMRPNHSWFALLSIDRGVQEQTIAMPDDSGGTKGPISRGAETENMPDESRTKRPRSTVL